MQREIGKGKWLKIALGISLALNLLIVGFVAGSYARHSSGHALGSRAPGLGAFGAPYMKALPRQERRAVLRRRAPPLVQAVVHDVELGAHAPARPFDAEQRRPERSKQH